MLEQDYRTIFALSTVYGKAGVAIIRISGSDAIEALRYLGVIKKIKPNQAIFANLMHPRTHQLIDQAVILYFASPHSFTGEDVIELQTHGSLAIIKILLSCLAEIHNFRPAYAGEFTKRAFLNSKIDLTQAEGIADLIEAETEMQVTQAAKQLSGIIAELYNSWRANVLQALSLLEAFIDFPDEDIPLDIMEDVEKMIRNTQSDIKKHLNDQKIGEMIRSGIEIAIVGKPNVGKSSLLNFLAKRDIAIVSNIPGTTRDVIELRMDLEGIPVIIYDTAGIRETEDLIEQEGVTRANRTMQNATLIVHIKDMSESAGYDNDVIKNIDVDKKKIIKLRNKVDLDTEKIRKQSDEPDVIDISINQKINLDKFIAYLTQSVQELVGDIDKPLISRERYRNALLEADMYFDAFDFEKPLELACEDIRLGARAIARITGHIDVEEILGIIFSSFCIGK